jgi:RNA polymerase sigma-70 factor (ECF subfamily)
LRLRSENAQAKTVLNLNPYLDGLYGYAIVLSRSGVEAEDLVQETCLRALRGVDGLRDDSSAKSWLFSILRNVWLKQLRHRRTAPDVVELDSDGSKAIEPADTGQDPYSAYVNKIEREQVRAAIQKLPVEFREIIILREYEELSYQQIGAVLECPPGTVMSRLARARSKLRELLAARLMSSQSEEKEADQANG